MTLEAKKQNQIKTFRFDHFLLPPVSVLFDFLMSCSVLEIPIHELHIFILFWFAQIKSYIYYSDRPEDLRIPFERFGPVKDVYLPKNYYTGYALFYFSCFSLYDVPLAYSWITFPAHSVIHSFSIRIII